MNTQRKRFSPFALASNANHISIANLQKVSSNFNLAASNIEDALPIEHADVFNAVMAYVLGITQTTLPTIPSPPSW